MTQQDAKKQEEKRFLDGFRSVCTNFPSGTIEPSENPDFLIHGANTIVGIEVLKLFQPTPNDNNAAKESESLRQRVMSQAQALHEKLTGSILKVVGYFDTQYKLTKKTVTENAQQIAEYVAANESLIDTTRVFEHDGINTYPSALTGLQIFRSPKPIWYGALTGFVWDVEESHLQSEIDGKNERCSDYLKKCSEVWLLMVAQNTAPSSFIDITAKIRAQTFNAKFARLFYFDWFSKAHSELTVAHS